MILIIGLGNPGKEYEKTRHNAGFMMLGRIKEAYKFPDFKLEKKFDAEVSVENARMHSDEKIILAKPQIFMNHSGQATKAILDFYKIPPENLIVIHDDIDIEIGKYKISTDSGSAGHNGIADIIEKIGTQKFIRIRIGIANDKLRAQIDPADFVLQKFSEEEIKTLENIFENILEEIEKLL
jgi:peptidyl-tRNA hydrolase, PTH1 family